MVERSFYRGLPPGSGIDTLTTDSLTLKCLGLIPWSPLAKGRLARKPSDEEQETLRAQTDAIGKRMFGAEELNITMAQRVSKVAEAHGVPMAQIALAWNLSNPVITAPIVGATKLHYLDDAVAALDVELGEDEIKYLEEPYVPQVVVGYE